MPTLSYTSMRTSRSSITLFLLHCESDQASHGWSFSSQHAVLSTRLTNSSVYTTHFIGRRVGDVIVDQKERSIGKRSFGLDSKSYSRELRLQTLHKRRR